MKRYLFATFLALAVIAACQRETNDPNNDNTGNNPAGTNRVNVYMTDDPAPLFDKVFLNILKMEIKVEDNGIDSLGGWRTLVITPGVFDILRFRNGLDTLFATGTLPANRKLKKIRFTLGNQNSVVLNGQSFFLEVKDNRNEVEANLDDSNVEETAPGQWSFWIDFDVRRSIQAKNNNTKFELKSKITIFSKGRSARIEGKVLPAAARAVVMAIRGSDTSTAIPESDGKFKIVGLRAGTYNVFFNATAGNYQDSLVTNINVANNQDVQLATVVLHQ
jgi:hypothetical protein